MLYADRANSQNGIRISACKFILCLTFENVNRFIRRGQNDLLFKEECAIIYESFSLGGIMNFLDRYASKTEFKDYDDLAKNYRVNTPDDFNFGRDIVDEYAKLEPNKTALVWCNDSGEEHIISFKDVSENSNRIANALYRAGIRKGDSVLVMLMSRYEYWYTIVALHKLGAIAIPATAQLTYKDIIYRCNFADVKAVVCVTAKGVADYVKEALPKCPTVKLVLTIGKTDFSRDFYEFYKDAPEDKTVFDIDNKTSDRMIAYFTSGTTGMPKMVSHDYSYPLAHMLTAFCWHKCKDGGLHFTAADTGWAKASWGKIYGEWIAGCAVFAYDYYGRYTPLDLLPLLEKYKVTSLCAPPTMYRFLIKEDLTKFDLSAIEHYTTAGEALNPEVYKQIMDKLGKPIYEGFGQTETVLCLGTFPFMTPHPGSMGRPSPLYEIVLLDENSKPVELGKEGEICMKKRDGQIGLLVGYVTESGGIRSVWKDGYYHTGDVAYMDEDGFCWFVGRDDDIIKSSGYRIGPFEVESALMEHPAVLECAITAVPDDVRGQVIKATIVLARNYFPSEELKKALQDHVKHTTAPYKYPRIVEFVERLPKTISDKIRRVEIRENDNKQ